jgi:hypothetical protein
MFVFVVKAVGNDVGEQFIKRQVGFKDTFFGQAHGFTKLFQLLAQGVQFGQITFKFK